jgi:hypothetical protein
MIGGFLLRLRQWRLRSAPSWREEAISKRPIEDTVAVRFEGRDITASYSVAANMVTVHTPAGDKTDHINGLTAKTMARKLLFELARDGKV